MHVRMCIYKHAQVNITRLTSLRHEYMYVRMCTCMHMCMYKHAQVKIKRLASVCTAQEAQSDSTQTSAQCLEPRTGAGVGTGAGMRMGTGLGVGVGVGVGVGRGVSDEDVSEARVMLDAALVLVEAGHLVLYMLYDMCRYVYT